MKIKNFLIEFVILFTVTLVVNAIVIYVLKGAFDWGLSFSLAIAIGIGLPLVHALESKD